MIIYIYAFQKPLVHTVLNICKHCYSAVVKTLAKKVLLPCAQTLQKMLLAIHKFCVLCTTYTVHAKERPQDCHAACSIVPLNYNSVK